jgi:hypothetical protein
MRTMGGFSRYLSPEYSVGSPVKVCIVCLSFECESHSASFETSRVAIGLL